MDNTEEKLTQIVGKYKPGGGVTAMLQNETGVETIEDVKYKQTTDDVKIYFGKMIFMLTKEQMHNPNIAKGLKQLDISYSWTKDGRVMMLWQGERMGEVK